MNRLFCLGDSFVDWDLPKYHWTYYLEKHFEVVYLGKRGADNYSILFQLGNLDDYREGDRILIVFTNPGRLPSRYHGERKEEYIGKKYHAPTSYKKLTFTQRLEYLRYEEEQRWIKEERDMEIKFLKNLKGWLSKYRPVFVTWSDSFYIPTSDFVTCIETTSNYEEGVGGKRDFHPGPEGCYIWYKKIHELLKIDEPVVDFKIELIEKNLL